MAACRLARCHRPRDPCQQHGAGHQYSGRAGLLYPGSPGVQHRWRGSLPDLSCLSSDLTRGFQAAVTLVAIALLFAPLAYDTGIIWIKPARTRVPWPLLVAAVAFVGTWAFVAATSFWGTRDVCAACPSKTLVVLGGTCFDCLDHVEGDADIELCRDNGNVTMSALEQKYHFYQATQGLNLVQMYVLPDESQGRASHGRERLTGDAQDWLPRTRHSSGDGVAPESVEVPRAEGEALQSVGILSTVGVSVNATVVDASSQAHRQQERKKEGLLE